MIDRFLNKVYHSDALSLLKAMPTASLDAVISDPMYGTCTKFEYDWGREPARGDPGNHWLYHSPMYQECRRVLKPNGVLAWAQGFKFVRHFNDWFGPHRVWSPLCNSLGLNIVPNTWVVQTRERIPIEHPNDMIVRVRRNTFHPLKALHPCPKPVEEMVFMISALTKPGQVVLDCFCGIGSTLVAAQQLGRRWIACDISKRYCQIAMKRLAEAGEVGHGPIPGADVPSNEATS